MPNYSPELRGCRLFSTLSTINIIVYNNDYGNNCRLIIFHIICLYFIIYFIYIL